MNDPENIEQAAPAPELASDVAPVTDLLDDDDLPADSGQRTRMNPDEGDGWWE